MVSTRTGAKQKIANADSGRGLVATDNLLAAVEQGLAANLRQHGYQRTCQVPSNGQPDSARAVRFFAGAGLAVGDPLP